MRSAAHICAAALAALFLYLVPAAAQQDLAEELERWETLANRAETAVDLEQGTDALFEALRKTVAEYRADFNAARDLNANRIATLREQIAALGTPPEGENAPPEDPAVAAKREELTRQLNEFLVPVQKAEAEFIRADALIRQIDRILRDRQTDELFRVYPTPLNPANWPQAVQDFVGGAQTLWGERPESEAAHSWEALREKLPPVVLLSVLGLVLILRGRAWSFKLVNRVKTMGADSIGIWRFLVSLLRIALPFAGVMLLALAAITTEFFGENGNRVILTLALLGGIMLGVRWVSDRVLSRDDDEALILLEPGKRGEARFYVSLITVMIVMSELVTLILEAGSPDAASKPVLVFPFFLISSLALFRISVILRGYSDAPSKDARLGEVRASTFSYLIRVLGTLGIAVSVVSPALLAAGYFNFAENLLPPFIMSLVLLGLVIALQRFAADIYGALTGRGAEAREALWPILIGMVLILLIAPLLALIWGARVTDLTEIWAAFARGFAIGDTRISPTDFLTFIIIFVIGYALTRLMQSALRINVLPKTTIDPGAQNAIVSGLGYVGIFTAALLAIIGAGIDLSSLAIVAGALSVGIGFGLQNIVSNFVSGIILLIERPISEGDWIEVGGQMGYVRDISVRSTRIETFDRTDVIVPNADLVSGTVTNYTRGNTIGRVIVPVGVAYGTDTKKVEGILREIAEAQPMVLAEPAPAILFLNFGADALEFEIRCFLRNVNWLMVVKNDINHEIARRFGEAGIEIPFAQRDVWLRNPEVLHTPPETDAAPPAAAGDASEAEQDAPPPMTEDDAPKDPNGKEQDIT